MRVLIVSLLFLWPQLTLASSLNAGFVDGLWLSKNPTFENEPVRVYIAVRNHTENDLSGHVTFYDNGTKFEQMRINALPGRIVEAWADWTPTMGDHTLHADLDRVVIDTTGAETEVAAVSSSLSKLEIFIDQDFDKDGIGNLEDTDDDGDGLSDLEERQAGTDPLSFDNPEATEEETVTTSNTNSIDVGVLPLPDNGPAGLEQYLANSQARASLLSITEVTNEAKRSLDAYRANRAEQKESAATENDTESQPVASSSDTVGTSTDVIGIITRTQSEQETTWWQQTLLAALATTVFVADLIYTTLLSLLSLLLGHPILVQVILLLLVLFIVLKLAYRFSKRPS